MSLKMRELSERIGPIGPFPMIEVSLCNGVVRQHVLYPSQDLLIYERFFEKPEEARRDYYAKLDKLVFMALPWEAA